MSDPVRCLSPNCGPRRDGLRPELIVLHYTAMASAQAALERLCDPAAEVSAHYLIGPAGQVWQMVDEDQRAWHAGAGQWQGRGDVNSRSIGIELDNRGDHPFAAAQMRALEALLAGIMARWAIRPEGVIAHSDMAPARKSDPGPRFDWQRLARQGLSVWPGATGGAPLPLEQALVRFGYPVEEAGLNACLSAFRLRFRPGACGPADATDAHLAQDLAARFGVDPAPTTA